MHQFIPAFLLLSFLAGSSLLLLLTPNMRIGFANIRRGFAAKGDDIEAFIHDNALQVLGLCETDLLKFEHPPSIPGFQCILSKDPARRVAAYIQNDINFLTIQETYRPLSFALITLLLVFYITSTQITHIPKIVARLLIKIV